MPELFAFHTGDTPLLVSIPHAGTHVPADVFDRFTPSAQSLPDTDWFLDQLYAWVKSSGASLIQATHSRYLIDLNRPYNDQPLYDSATTGLIPTVQFDGQPIYRTGQEPTDEEKGNRIERYYWPYHDQIQHELRRIIDRFGWAVLFDAHSIRSKVPRLFPGILPDLNLGTHDGASCDPTLATGATAALRASQEYTLVVNGRFKGGHITRHYGQPHTHAHAIQLELAQENYMDEQTSEYNASQAANVSVPVRRLVQSLIDWRPVSQ